MKKAIANISRHLYSITCVSATLSMAIFWVYKYSWDEDLCLVDYKRFEDGTAGTYPTVSLCFSEPFLKQKMEEFGTNISSYIGFLRGETDDANAASIDYDAITLVLMDYHISHTISWKNGSKFKYNKFAHSDLLITNQTFNGFWYSGIFLKCYGIEVMSKEIDYFIILFNQEIFPNKTRPPGTNARTKRYFVVSYHYPQQMLALTSAFQNYIWPKVKLDYKMTFVMRSFEIITRRNKRRNPCLDHGISYDTFTLQNYMNEIGCIPPYLNNTIELPICKDKEKMRKTSIQLLNKKSTSSQVINPCEYIGNLQFSYSEQHYGGNGDIFSVSVNMPVTFKHVIQTQAIGAESLIGTIGGYLGLFCGIHFSFIFA